MFLHQHCLQKAQSIKIISPIACSRASSTPKASLLSLISIAYTANQPHLYIATSPTRPLDHSPCQFSRVHPAMANAANWEKGAGGKEVLLLQHLFFFLMLQWSEQVVYLVGCVTYVLGLYVFAEGR